MTTSLEKIKDNLAFFSSFILAYSFLLAALTNVSYWGSFSSHLLDKLSVSEVFSGVGYMLTVIGCLVTLPLLILFISGIKFSGYESMYFNKKSSIKLSLYVACSGFIIYYLIKNQTFAYVYNMLVSIFLFVSIKLSYLEGLKFISSSPLIRQAVLVFFFTGIISAIIWGKHEADMVLESPNYKALLILRGEGLEDIMKINKEKNMRIKFVGILNDEIILVDKNNAYLFIPRASVIAYQYGFPNDGPISNLRKIFAY